MPASISEFVDVNVLVAGATAERFQFGSLMFVAFHTATVNRQDGPYFSLAEVVAAGFTEIAEPAVYGWAAAVFAQDDGVESVIIGRIDAGDLTLTAALNAIEAAGPDTWYITNIESRLDTDILEAAAWTETREKIYIAQSADPTILTGDVLSIAGQLQTINYNRTALIYHDDDTEWLDGAWSSSGGGLNLDAPGGVGVWAFRSLEGVPFDDVSATEAANIYALGANLNGRNLGLNFTSKGTMASGRFIDVQTTIDWVKRRSEEEILSLFVGTPTKIPYTNQGINTVVSAEQAVLDRGVTFGHFSEDAAPYIVSPDIKNVSTTLKQTRCLQLTGFAVLAGAIQKLELTLNVSF